MQFGLLEAIPPGIKELTQQNPGWFKPNDILSVDLHKATDLAPNQTAVVLKLHVTNQCYNRFLPHSKTNITFAQQQIRMYEEIDVEVCFKCCKYDHKTPCPRPPICLYCSQTTHSAAECPHKNHPSRYQCHNCLTFNQQVKNKTTPGIPWTADGLTDTNHNARASQCHVLKNLKDQRRMERKEQARQGHPYTA